MKQAVIILATTHTIQCGLHPLETVNLEFETLVSRILDENEILHISEEWSLDALEEWKVKFTVAKKIARKQKTKHFYIDLNRKKRFDFGINFDFILLSNGKLFKSDMSSCRDKLTRLLTDPIRERLWISKILQINVWPMLFICGLDHVESVYQLFSDLEEFDVTVERFEPVS